MKYVNKFIKATDEYNTFISPPIVPIEKKRLDCGCRAFLRAYAVEFYARGKLQRVAAKYLQGAE